MKFFCIAAAVLACVIARAAPPESMQDLAARFTPEQKQQFDAAYKAFSSDHYTESFAGFKALLAQIPGDAVLSKLAAESGLNSGDAKFAIESVRPIAQADPDDWQAAALLARAYATSGDTKARDAAMASMFELRKRNITPPSLKSYISETIKTGDNTLTIKPSLVPFGPYNIYYVGQVRNTEGQVILSITVESADFDQSFFAEQHPKEAKAGLRGFSLDGYKQTGVNTQTHMTFQFFVGEPSYDTVREKFLAVAENKIHPVTSRSGIPAH